MQIIEEKKQKKCIFYILKFCNKLYSCMIEIWMKNHLVSDSTCNIIKSIMPNYVKEWQLMLGLHLVLVTPPVGGLQLVLSKTYRIGETKYNI